MATRRPDEFFDCPHCGAPVPAGRSSCRACGSDARTGWSRDADLWSSDIPGGYGADEGFDYDEFVRREFPDRAPPRPGATLKKWAVGVVVVIVCIVFLYWMLRT